MQFIKARHDDNGDDDDDDVVIAIVGVIIVLGDVDLSSLHLVVNFVCVVCLMSRLFFPLSVVVSDWLCIH